MSISMVKRERKMRLVYSWKSSNHSGWWWCSVAWPGTLSPGLPGNVAYLDDRVEEDQGDDQPEHELRLADVSDGSSVLTVPPGNHWYFTRGYNWKVNKWIMQSHFSNLFILFCRKVSGAPERSASASIVVSWPLAPCTLFTKTHDGQGDDTF